jgi:hypothetical protein
VSKHGHSPQYAASHQPRAHMLRRAIGLQCTSHHDKCVNDGPEGACHDDSPADGTLDPTRVVVAGVLLNISYLDLVSGRPRRSRRQSRRYGTHKAALAGQRCRGDLMSPLDRHTSSTADHHRSLSARSIAPTWSSIVVGAPPVSTDGFPTDDGFPTRPGTAREGSSLGRLTATSLRRQGRSSCIGRLFALPPAAVNWVRFVKLMVP